MFRRSTGPLLFSLAVALGSAAMARAAGPITVESLTYEGSGCPAGSVAFNLSPDRTAFALLFDAYIAEVGPGVPEKERARECAVGAVLSAPPGWSWAIVGVDHRGFAALQAGMSATLKTSFVFNRQKADHREAPPLQRSFLGPISDEYLATTDTPALQIDWSKCGGTSELHIKTRLEIDPGRSTGHALFTLDSLDGDVTQLDGTTVCGYRVIWRRCG